ncbi:MAG: hypothetical protein Q6373_000095 [Candidatus Sigynarchaeota archaeon]
METRDFLSHILGLFTAEELKALGKEIDLKGMFKMTKGDLVKAIMTQIPEETISRFLNGEGKKKIQETIKNAFILLGGGSIAAERLASIKFQADVIVAKFDGMRWTTQCSSKIAQAGAPAFDHACTCKVAETGAFCIHFWVVLLQLLAEGKLSITAIGPFADLAGAVIESNLKSVKPRASPAPKVIGDINSKPLDQLLQAWTMEGRYERALDELGRGDSPTLITPPKQTKPAKTIKVAKPAGASATKKEGDAGVARPERKAKKPPAEPYHVEVKFATNEPGPPAKILATLVKVTAAKKEALPFHILLDEEDRVVAHDGCKDFEIRLRRKQLLCKHLLQVFLNIDEGVARRLLGNLDAFEFTSIMPSQKDAPLTLPEAVMKLKPDVRVGDDDTLKGKILDYLLANEAFPEKLSVDAITKELGAAAVALLPVMVAENMIEEVSPGRYKPK